MAAWVMRAIPAAIAEVHRWKPDVIHAHFAVPTGAVAWAVHKVTGVPYVLTAHLGDVPGGVPEQTGNMFRWIKPFTVPIWRDAAATTAVSSFVAGLANDAYGVRPKIILNGIELPATPELKRPEIPRLLMVGRMSVQKNPLAAVRALALLKDLPWTMSVIGDGPLLAGMRAETERLGLASRIEFRGWATAAEVSVEMGNSSILVMPSLSEGLPMVAVEALTHGLAIVGSRIGGLSDVVEEGGNGRLFELDSGAEGLAQALKPLLEDPVALLRAREASLAMMPRFDLEGALDAYEQVLNDVSK
jgi:glycosyltransferase involved in cell wall biosynthesis